MIKLCRKPTRRKAEQRVEALDSILLQIECVYRALLARYPVKALQRYPVKAHQLSRLHLRKRAGEHRDPFAYKLNFAADYVNRPIAIAEGILTVLIFDFLIKYSKDQLKELHVAGIVKEKIK